MNLKQLNPWRFLAFRLFSWFWLVLLMTLLVAALAAKSLVDDTEIRRLPPGVFEEVRPVVHSLQHFDSVEELSRKINRRDRNRWLVVDAETNTVLNSSILPKNFDQHWLTELSQLNRPRLLLHKKTVLAGPFLVDFHGRQLALYQQRERPNRQGFNLEMLPQYTLLLLLLLFSALASIGLALTITKPLRLLQQMNLQFAAGDLATRVQGPERRSDEIGELARGFNLMASHIGALVQNQQRLLRDISHELRSPLTRAQLAIALEQRQGGGLQLPRLQQELERIDQMLDELLTFSRLDAGQYQLSAQELDVVELIEEVMSVNQLEADNRLQQLNYQGPAQAFAFCDSRLIARAIENVLRNAIKYSPNTSTISLDLKASDGQILLTIKDQGPGVPAAALQAVFEPFYRVSDSRNSQTGGTGLGLAIASQALRQHQGHISASLPADGGLAVLLQWPQQPSSMRSE
jgi:two-component system sensor histidine kinase CpxA